MTIIATANGASTTSGMTFIQLVQRLWYECQKAGDPPTTIIGVTGEKADFVRWIQWAWIDIQTSHQDWLWMRLTTSFVTVDGQSEYNYAECGIGNGAFGRWIPSRCRVYPTATGNTAELPMSYERDYDAWRDTYIINGNRNVRTMPIVVTVTPSKGLGLGPVPAAGYTVTAPYYKAPVLLSFDSELPDLPSQHDPMIIVYRAMKRYARAQSAPEIYEDVKEDYLLMMQRLTDDQLPMLSVGGCLG